MIRVYLAELARGVTVALCIAIVIAFASVGCMLNKRDAERHNVKGVRASSMSLLSTH